MAKTGNPNEKVYAYWDRFAKIWTIGWGSTYLNGRKVQENDVITREEAERIFEQEVIQQEKYVRPTVDLNKLNDNQYAILISISYNAGIGNLKKTRILPAINSGKSPQEVSAIIRDSLTTSRGATVPGLVRRRREEADFYLSPVIAALKTPKGIGVAIGILLVLGGISYYLYNKLIKK
jgi:lysozyme